MSDAYYNENDEFAAAWLRNLIAAGLVARGEVDTRSIVDVRPADLAGFRDHHFFAGIGGWSYALGRAGWTRPVWTGSCPCQPFSLIGKRQKFDDDRHLWPAWRSLISERAPPVILGEQVATAPQWLGLVRGDLEAASEGAEHLRDRYWFVAERGVLVDGIEPRLERHAGDVDPRAERAHSARPAPAPGCEFDLYLGADGKIRRAKSGVRLLADGFPNRVGLLRGFGNAIDARPAQAFIETVMEFMP